MIETTSTQSQGDWGPPASAFTPRGGMYELSRAQGLGLRLDQSLIRRWRDN